MNVSIVILFLGALIFSAHALNGLFKKTRIPSALWLLIIGIIIGPITGWVKQEHFGEIGPVFTSITLIILLFEGGVNLKIKEIGSSIGSSFLLTISNFLISATLATCFAFYLTTLNDWVSASFFGVIVGGTSSAVVIPIVNQLKINKESTTILLLESALSDVFCLVIGLGLLSSMELGVFDAKQIVNVVWKSFLFAALAGFLLGIIWSIVLKKIRTIENNMFTNLAIVFIVAGATEWIGWNGGIATLIFGITLGNAYLLQNTLLKKVLPSKELAAEERSFFSEIAFILQTYFFVYVGATIKFGSPVFYIVGLVIVASIAFIRPFTIRLLVRKKMPVKDLAIMGIMSPKGLVPAILASIPVQLGLAGGHIIQDLAYSVVLISILLCSVLVVLINSNFFSNSFLNRLFGRAEQEEPIAEPESQIPPSGSNDDNEFISDESFEG